MKTVFLSVVLLVLLPISQSAWAGEADSDLEKRVEMLEERINKLEQMLKMAVMGAVFGNARGLQDSEATRRQEVQNTTSKPDPAIEAYKKKVILYDLTAGYYNTYLDKRKPGVEFKLRNTGDKTLSKVEVTIYFLGKNGKVISEEDFYPVLSGGISRGKPLRPNYIWQLESGKFYQAPNVPSEWKAGAVTGKVTDIEFFKE